MDYVGAKFSNVQEVCAKLRNEVLYANPDSSLDGKEHVNFYNQVVADKVILLKTNRNLFVLIFCLL